MEFRLLGSLEVRRDGALVRLGGPRERAVLAALLLRANQVARIGHLVDAVWERPPASPETNLRTYVSGLRRRLDPDRFVTRPGGYLVTVHPGELDLTEFDQAGAEGHSALERGAPAEAVEAFRRALRLWRDEPLSGESYGPTLRAEIEQLTARRIDTIEGYARATLEAGGAPDVIDKLSRFVADYPLREELWALLIQALYQAGRRPDALATYTRARNRLLGEVGVEPGPRLRNLHSAILRDEPDEADPASLTVPSAPSPAQIPADLATFTGRSAELARLADLLDDARATIVVAAIDGMAGVGKTALAIRFAHSVRHLFPDGQLFLDLHAHTADVDPLDPAAALDHLLRSIGVPGSLIPSDVDGRAALYRSRLADRRILVVLDNAMSERQLAPLLPAGPGSLVVVTSRRRLSGLDDATPLTLDQLSADDAISLFTLVAGKHRTPSTDAGGTAEIVGLCGGLPLAVRIAAARFRDRPAWTLAQLSGRLRDERRRLTELEVGERSVAATFGLSYRQLGSEQQRGFRLLGLTPGADIDLPAAAALLDRPALSAGNVLDSLTDAHMLIEHLAGRYRFHDLLRDYAVHSCAELPAAERAEAVTRVLEHYARTAALAMDELYPHDSAARPAVDTTGAGRPADPAGWLDAELGNLLATASHAVRNGRPSHSILLSRLLRLHLRTRGRYAQAEQLHSLALAVATELDDHAGQLDALRGLADSFFLTGRVEAAEREYQRALELARENGIVSGEGMALRGLGAVHREAGRMDEAERCYRAALDAARRSGDRNGERHAELSLGHVRVLTGDHDVARGHYRRSLDIAVELGDRIGQAEAVGSLGLVHRRTGDDDAAVGYYQQALVLGRTTGDQMSEAHALHGLGLLHEQAGDHERALRCHRNGLEIARAIGDPRWQFEARHGIGRVLTAQGRYAAAFAEHETALRLARDLGVPNGRARVLHSLGSTELGLGRPDRARAHWQEALRLFTELGAPQADEVADSLSALREPPPSTPAGPAQAAGRSARS